MRIIKQSSTSRSLVFLMVDSTNHIIGKTGLSPTVTISKNGASFVSPSGAISEIGNGLYKVAGNATDSNTLGSLILHAEAAGADPCDIEFEVVAFDPQSSTSLGLSSIDGIKAKTDQMVFNSGKIDATAVSVSDKTGYSLSQVFPANFASLGINVSGHISRVTLVDTTTVNTDMITATAIRSAVGLATNNLDTQLSSISGYLDTEIAAIKSKTDQMVFTTAGRLDATAVGVLDKTGYSLSQAFPANFASLGINASGHISRVTLVDTTTANTDMLTAASIRTSVGLSSANLDTQLSNINGFIDTEISSIKTVTDKLDTALELDGLVYRFTTNALELAPTGGAGGATDWTTDERAAIRSILGIPVSGTVPTDPSSGILDTIRDLVVIVDSVADAIEVDTQNIQSRIPAALVGGRIAANAEVVSDKTGYSLTQSFPANFASLGINASGHVSRVTLVDTTTTNTDMLTSSGVRSSIGLASANLDTQISTINSYIDTEIAAIKSKTDQMVFTTAGRLDVTAVSVLDKTGYSLSQAFPSNFSSMNISIDGKILLQPTQTGVTIPTVTSITNPVGVGSIGINAITSDALASSAVLEIQSGLSTLTSSDIRAALGLASANLDTQLGNIYADTTNLKTRLPTSLINNRIDATIGNIQNNTITNLAIATNAIDEIVHGVWDEAYNQHTTAGTFGKLMDLLRKANTLVEGTVTAATTPTSTTFSSTLNYPTGALEHSVLMWVTGNLSEQNSPILTYNNTNGQLVLEEAFTSAPQVGDQFIIAPITHVHAVTDIQSGLARESTSQSILSGVNTLTSRITSSVASMFQDLSQMIQGTGTALAKWTATALSLAPTGSGGAGNITVNANILPIQSYMRKRVEAETMSLYYGELTDVFISTEDENGPVDLTSKTLNFVIETKNKTNLLVIENADIGKSVNGATVRITTAVTNNIGTYIWALRDTSGGTDTVLSQGFAEVSYAPKA